MFVAARARSWARAHGVTTNFAEIEALVPSPDITVLLTLDEEERQRRLRSRGKAPIHVKSSATRDSRAVAL